ncbi:DUF4376 domain-containing protein [Pseudomonas quasicaspiana]|uniref:DUF4376 domain-containing protein n=1 Tax=Pseudomonas quasicaspiana TaxID=2829821 RepID=UPI001E48FB7B|nr:hypothetical protein [Pseudomonas quasicaspiana]MCD5970436.1 hypothetical protein [Pseudomonas quasicaspiana]
MFDNSGKLAYLVDGIAATPDDMRAAPVPADIASVLYQFMYLKGEKIEYVVPASSGWQLVNGQLVESITARLERSYSAALSEINQAAEQAITAGFTSQALGEPYLYSSAVEDQLNLTSSIQSGTDALFACRDAEGVRDLRLHTAAQLRQVGEDFNQYKLAVLLQANALKQELDQALNAKDVERLESIHWETPE